MYYVYANWMEHAKIVTLIPFFMKIISTIDTKIAIFTRCLKNKTRPYNNVKTNYE